MLSVSLAALSGVRISAVYTPPEFRGRGYASAAVAYLTSDKIRQGASYASLVVETEDEHLHRLYGRIGFQRDDSRLNIIVDEPDSASATPRGSNGPKRYPPKALD